MIMDSHESHMTTDRSFVDHSLSGIRVIYAKPSGSIARKREHLYSCMLRNISNKIMLVKHTISTRPKQS